jgi:hypothetical protein
MASNFKIFSLETRDSLHLKLDGDFDGNSAHELLNTLKKYGVAFIKSLLTQKTLKLSILLERKYSKKTLVLSKTNLMTLSLSEETCLKLQRIRSS